MILYYLRVLGLWRAERPESDYYRQAQGPRQLPTATETSEYILEYLSENIVIPSLCHKQVKDSRQLPTATETLNYILEYRLRT